MQPPSPMARLWHSRKRRSRKIDKRLPRSRSPVPDPCFCYKDESENEEEPQSVDEVAPVNNGLSGVNCARTKETKKSENVRGFRLIDKVDLVSAVSGGGVTAAYWALKGPDGLHMLKERFLCKDVQGQLIIETIVNPIRWFRLSMPSYSRIDVFKDYLDKELFKRDSSKKHRYWDYDYDQEVFDKVFEGATYKDLINKDNNHPKRPSLILNATDMATGRVFSFTQDMFDFLCADRTKFKLADAVAASAAYPVLFTRADRQELLAGPRVSGSITVEEANTGPRKRP